ncbi:MAG: T9SS type A sorting domain-containing protein, partial [Bacteroidota bacterium]|nr:T9SS type A sorting domain-containing protein [Bacteroidota bacterium]
NNCDGIMTSTNPLALGSLANPHLTFWTKWEIESGWDYAQVKASSNNGTSWVELAGHYTHPGGTHQVPGPLYDGTQSTWVKEDININNYKSDQFKLRFELKSDGSQTKDGWYVDDIGVYVYVVTPVELTSFVGGVQSNAVVLNWNTATELNNKGFEIERGIQNGGRIVYNSIGFIQGNGTVQEPVSYKFVDKEPLPGVSYYRIKQIDFQGTYRIYGPLEINNDGIKSYSLEQNYPNPFNPATNIKFSIPKSGLVTLQIFDILGKEVYTNSKEYQQAGSYTINIDASKLSSGTYFYKLSSGKFTETKKMQILK